MSIKHSIEADMKYTYTPDLPRLRYCGAVPIFLWDDLTDFQLLATILGSTPTKDNYRSWFGRAVTEEKFLPWYNICSDKFSYATYCMRDFTDTSSIELPDYALEQPRRVLGKMAKVSLAALQELDLYYDNERHFKRVLISVQPTPYSTMTKACYTWMNTADGITEFDTKLSEYALMDNIDPTPFSTETINQEEFYKY